MGVGPSLAGPGIRKPGTISPLASTASSRPSPSRALYPVLFLLCVLAAGLTPEALAAGHGEPGKIHVARVDLRDAQQDLKLLDEMRIDIGAVRPGWARVYLLEEEIDKLRGLGFQVTLLPPDELRHHTAAGDEVRQRDVLQAHKHPAQQVGQRMHPVDDHDRQPFHGRLQARRTGSHHARRAHGERDLDDRAAGGPQP